MSTTVTSITAVGVPGAAAPARTPAADDGVPTQLPPGHSVGALDNGQAMRLDSRAAGRQLARQVVMDTATAMMVYQVVDRRSGSVVRQFPEAAVLRRRAYFRALDAMSAATAAPPQISRKA